MSARLVPGYVNAAAFNVRPEGDTRFFATREARDAALSRKRAAAIASGLAESAARAGIYPINVPRADAVLTMGSADALDFAIENASADAEAEVQS